MWPGNSISALHQVFKAADFYKKGRRRQNAFAWEYISFVHWVIYALLPSGIFRFDRELENYFIGYAIYIVQVAYSHWWYCLHADWLRWIDYNYCVLIRTRAKNLPGHLTGQICF